MSGVSGARYCMDYMCGLYVMPLGTIQGQLRSAVYTLESTKKGLPAGFRAGNATPVTEI